MILTEFSLSKPVILRHVSDTFKLDHEPEQTSRFLSSLSALESSIFTWNEGGCRTVQLCIAVIMGSELEVLMRA